MRVFGNVLSNCSIWAGANRLSQDPGDATDVLPCKWSSVLSSLNISALNKPHTSTLASAMNVLKSCTAEALQSWRKEEILKVFANLIRRQPSSLRKQILIENLLQLGDRIKD